jgi:hypothetical protein
VERKNKNNNNKNKNNNKKRSKNNKSPKLCLGDLNIKIAERGKIGIPNTRNYRTEFHETWWSYRYMFLVDPKVFRSVVKGVKVIFLGVQMGWGLL